MQFLFQFGDLSSLEQHGFARNRMWSLDRDPSPLPPLDNQSSVDLILKSTEVDLKTPCRYIWIQTVFASFSFSLSTFLLIKDKALLNGTIKCLTCPYLFGCFCSFEFRLRISLNAGKLILIPRVRNTANKAFSFSFTLCNYLSVSDIRCAS